MNLLRIAARLVADAKSKKETPIVTWKYDDTDLDQLENDTKDEHTPVPPKKTSQVEKAPWQNPEPDGDYEKAPWQKKPGENVSQGEDSFDAFDSESNMNTSQQEQTGYVKKTPGKGYCVKSEPNSDWSGGCYPTKGEANKRLEQVEAAKYAKGG